MCVIYFEVYCTIPTRAEPESCYASVKDHPTLSNWQMCQAAETLGAGGYMTTSNVAYGHLEPIMSALPG